MEKDIGEMEHRKFPPSQHGINYKGSCEDGPVIKAFAGWSVKCVFFEGLRNIRKVTYLIHVVQNKSLVIQVRIIKPDGLSKKEKSNDGNP